MLDVPIVYATGPIRKPKPIKLMTDPDGRIQSVPHTPVQAIAPQVHHKRPLMVRAATLDGRSLSEVIDAAHRASLNEQTKSSSSKSPTSIHERLNLDSRRIGLPYPTQLGGLRQSSDYQRRLSASYEYRTDIGFDLYCYDALA